MTKTTEENPCIESDLIQMKNWLKILHAEFDKLHAKCVKFLWRESLFLEIKRVRLWIQGHEIC